MRIKTFTQGKTSDRNEDASGYNDTTVVVSDGATDKSGKRYDGKTGGEILSRLLVQECLASELNGRELVASLSERVRELYQEINPKALDEPALRFLATLVCARVADGKLHITQVGDTGFRVNGEITSVNEALINVLTANARRHYIEVTKDVPGGRDFIMPLLRNQPQYLNNAGSPLGYGQIDGFEVPAGFIKTFDFPLETVRTLEIFTDGYFALPETSTIEAYEGMYERVEREDPDKYKKYLSTKPSDDRTVVIVEFNSIGAGRL